MDDSANAKTVLVIKGLEETARTTSEHMAEESSRRPSQLDIV